MERVHREIDSYIVPGVRIGGTRHAINVLIRPKEGYHTDDNPIYSDLAFFYNLHRVLLSPTYWFIESSDQIPPPSLTVAHFDQTGWVESYTKLQIPEGYIDKVTVVVGVPRSKSDQRQYAAYGYDAVTLTYYLHTRKKERDAQINSALRLDSRRRYRR